jgi:DNA-binding Xre family transcriptional regulator
VKVVNSHFRVLVAQKELREKRRIGIRVIVEETGAARSAVQRLLNNTIREVPLEALAALCEWVPCEPGDILKLEPLPEEFAPAPVQAAA